MAAEKKSFEMNFLERIYENDIAWLPESKSESRKITAKEK